ncbi:MAG: DHH family phosphoesterase [Oscillospiraceae bacterium]|jgi:phosphoesterase RecJ-like protein|nr:DHH family phosphoesterase [Oscillospiraceae bacterium]
MKSVISFFQLHDRYLLLTHRRPDGDTLGSASALCAGLRSLGKTAYVWRNPEITPRHLPFVAPFFPPDGFIHETAVAVDTAAGSMLPIGIPAGVIDFRIDHHPGVSPFANETYTDPGAAACGEVVFDLLAALGAPLTADIAANLYIALSTDTGLFRYSNTTAKTHRIASALIAAGADHHALNAIFFGKTQSRVEIEKTILAGLRFGFGAAVASLSLAERGGATEDDLEDITSLVQNIEGVSAGFLLREEAGYWRVSCRTTGAVEANAICKLLSDGGGHRHAAGGRIPGNLSSDEARKIVLDAYLSVYPEARDKQC